MSKITTIIDALRSDLLTAFPNKTLLADPITLENNANGLLIDGYGLYCGAGNSSDVDILHSTSEKQIINVVFTRELLSTDHNPLPYQVVEKAMFEDKILVVKNFLAIDKLNISSSFDIIEYINHSGIESVVNDKRNYINLIVTFEVTITEEL